ncbi:outer membrane beta-barrel protein [Novosphingobium mathurense]|uniref:outer membrane beta-barrel protein n=1 Tax=Novosphingobium mathurense TaxID=428990 RepID=UPI001FE78871|nr:outer membrane beta-barrel protein [Novosphingobium mathurense]
MIQPILIIPAIKHGFNAQRGKEFRKSTGFATNRTPISTSRTVDLLEIAPLILRLAFSKGEQRERLVQHVIYVGMPQDNRSRPSLAARGAIFLALFAMPRVASAQAVDVVETPTDIFEPERGAGIPISGSLFLYNTSALQGIYDSNIYNVEQNRTNDTSALLQSEFHLTTNLARHEVGVRAGVTTRKYSDTSAENSTTYHVDGHAHLDLGDRIDVYARGGYLRGIEIRGTAGDQFLTDRPVRFDDKYIEGSIERTGGILEAGLAGSFTRRKYLNASINDTSIDLSFRDAEIKKATLKASYRLSPVMRLYSEFSVNDVTYDQNLGVSRDSKGYSALAGIHYEVSKLVDVIAAVGYIHQKFDAPGTKAATGLNYRVEATWTPTPKWKLTASGERFVDSSPLSDIPAIVRSDFRLKVQRALGDRMLVEAGAVYTGEDYRGLSGTDRRYTGYGNVQYRITRNISAVVEGGYRKQSGGASGRSYSGASVSAGIRVAL